MTNTNAVPQVAPDFEQNVQKFAVTAGLNHTAGRVYDKVHAPNESGRYMVERKTGDIYGIKSWNQHNPRRFYGNLTTVDQWNWSVFPAEPVSADAIAAHQTREATFAQTYKKRGRPVGVKNKPKTLSVDTTV